jgi:hypothetical protein
MISIKQVDYLKSQVRFCTVNVTDAKEMRDAVNVKGTEREGEREIGRGRLEVSLEG